MRANSNGMDHGPFTDGSRFPYSIYRSSSALASHELLLRAKCGEESEPPESLRIHQPAGGAPLGREA